MKLFTVAALLTAFPLLAANDPFAENVRTTDPLAPDEQTKTFQAPPGFTVQLVAAEPQLRKPMNMQFDTLGRLWFTESREYPWPTNYAAPRDTIRILSDFDEHGRARTVTTFATNLNIPIGLYPFQSPASDGSGKLTWKCIGWSIPNIWLFEDTDGDGTADKKDKLYGPFDHTRDTHGNQSSFRRGLDGWLYAHHGFNNDSRVRGADGNEVSMNSGNSYRIHFDGSRIEHYTWGQVNPFGMSFDDFGNLYSSDCHSAPTYQLLAGGYYPSFGKPHDGLGFAPVLMEHSHGSTAIDAMLFYADDLWPAEFKDNIFVGNVMTSRMNRDRLVFNGSSPRAVELDDFVKTSDPWFRPVDSLLGPDGAMYIADFYNRIIGHYEVPLPHPGRDRERGRIFRVIYNGEDGQAKLRSREMPKELDGLLAELASPSLARRTLAANAIFDQMGKSAVASLQGALAEPKNGFQRVHVLWLLQRYNALPMSDLKAAAQSEDRLVRVHAQRIANTFLEDNRRPGVTLPTSNVAASLQIATEGLKDRDALVQRCAAEAYGNFTGALDLRPLLELRHNVPAADTHLLYVVRKSLRNLLRHETGTGKLLAESWNERDSRALADVAVAVNNPGAAKFLVAHLQKHSESRRVTADYLKHAARYLPEDAVDDLATLGRDKFADDIDLQSTLFKSVLDGLKQRGASLSFRLNLWGSSLANDLVSSVRRVESDWVPLPVDHNPASANPWVVQNRGCADGKNADLLSSLPQGEQLTGIYRSKPFAAPETLKFFLAGHDGYPDKPIQKKNSVRLRDADSFDVLAETNPPRNDTAQPVSWDLKAHAGKQVFLELVDGDTAGAYAWLAVGRFEPAMVALPKITTQLVDSRLQGAAQIALAVRDQSLEPALSGALSQPAGVDTRAAIATTLLALNAKQHLTACGGIAADQNAPMPLREKVGQAISEHGGEEGRALLVTIVRDASERLQPRLALPLVATKQGAEGLLGEVEAGRVSARLLQDRAVKEKLLASKPENANARIAKLTQDLTPLNEALQKQIDQRRAAYNAGTASTDRGLAVFEKNCGACHQIDGKGAVIGPQLDGIGARGAERIIEDTIDPNRNVDHAFRATIFTLDDDDVISGLFRREEGETVVYAESTGKEQSIPKSRIKERRESELSLMPENLADAMTPEEFNDLLAFLLSKSGTKK